MVDRAMEGDQSAHGRLPALPRAVEQEARRVGGEQPGLPLVGLESQRPGEAHAMEGHPEVPCHARRSARHPLPLPEPAGPPYGQKGCAWRASTTALLTSIHWGAFRTLIVGASLISFAILAASSRLPLCSRTAASTCLISLSPFAASSWSSVSRSRVSIFARMLLASYTCISCLACSSRLGI